MTQAKYRSHLPQVTGAPILTDGGLETTLIFHDGFDLPCFAAFVLLRQQDGRAALMRYYGRYAQMSIAQNCGFMLEAPTWRASAAWGDQLGYDAAELAEANRAAIDLMVSVRESFGTLDLPFVISGNIGPRGDGYVADNLMSVAEAEAYHSAQIAVFADTAADLVTAVTINYVEEAIGIVRAAGKHAMPVVISFTVETDGRLPTGQALGEAIMQADAATGNAPAYYMINCAHPDHFREAIAKGDGWVERIRGIRANASRMSHAELDNADELDAGDPEELGALYRELFDMMPQLVVLGGCCGTDHRHLEAIGHACYQSHAAE